MKLEERETLTKLLETQCKADPPAFRRKVIWLILVGYVYIVGMIGFLILLNLIILWLTITHSIIYAKFLLATGIALLAVLASLHVKMQRPSGVYVQETEMPTLFQLIEDVRRAGNGPRIDHVVLNSEFNCAVSQLGDWGLLGKPRNYLILGMPFLQTLTLSEFRAVLAHEMGHLSQQHGTLPHWLYFVRMVWAQVHANLGTDGLLRAALMARFTNWYFPRLDAYSSVWLRDQEYAADQAALAVSDENSAIIALLKTHSRGSLFAEAFKLRCNTAVMETPQPPTGLLQSCYSVLTEPISVEQAKSLLGSDWTEHQIGDTHPSLSERIHALIPADRTYDLDTAARTVAAGFLPGQSAAQAVFAEQLTQVDNKVEDQWRQELSPFWQEQHNAIVSYRTRLAELNEIRKVRSLDASEATELAHLSKACEQAPVAIANLRTLLASHPDNAQVMFELGSLLLETKSEEGVEYVEKAMELSPKFGLDCCVELSNYYRLVGQHEMSKAYYRKFDALRSDVTTAISKMQLEMADGTVTYTAVNLTESQRTSICAVLARYDAVNSAYLIRAKLPDLLGEARPSLVVKFDAWRIIVNEQALILSDILHANPNDPLFLQLSVISWGSADAAMGKACKTDPATLVYRRGQ